MLELRSELLGNLSQRFMARTIKLVLGPQVRCYSRLLPSAAQTSLWMSQEYRMGSVKVFPVMHAARTSIHDSFSVRGYLCAGAQAGATVILCAPGQLCRASTCSSNSCHPGCTAASPGRQRCSPARWQQQFGAGNSPAAGA